jgi:hypothetical protein
VGTIYTRWRVIESINDFIIIKVAIIHQANCLLKRWVDRSRFAIHVVEDLKAKGQRTVIGRVNIVRTQWSKWWVKKRKWHAQEAESCVYLRHGGFTCTVVVLNVQHNFYSMRSTWAIYTCLNETSRTKHNSNSALVSPFENLPRLSVEAPTESSLFIVVASGGSADEQGMYWNPKCWHVWTVVISAWKPRNILSTKLTWICLW